MKLRKTITFDKEVYDAIQKERAKVLMKGMNMTFTEAVNLLCISGLKEAKILWYTIEHRKEAKP